PNSEVMEETRVGPPEGLVIVAAHQTAGRGRLGRTRSAAPGTSLLVSVLLRPPLPISEVPAVLMAAGLAACDGVEGAAGFRPQLKWPNDLVVGDRKLAGLLTESTPGEVTAVILGLGVNVTADAYPAELAGAATSCEEEAQRPVDRAELLVAFLTALEARYSTVLVQGGREKTMEAYRAGSAAGMAIRSASSRISARVTPRRQPEDSGGVRSTPAVTTKTFVPVPSHSSPRVLAKIASPAPAAVAIARARTFSP